MSHHIYHTDGLILQCAPLAEANLWLTILTRDLGLVQATAQGVRTMNSKLRFALHDLSVAKLSFVLGKGAWKVTSAIPQESIYFQLKAQKFKLQTLLQVFKALRRLVTGEEENKALFSLLEKYYQFLVAENLDQEEVKLSEYVILLRVLHNLGYVDQDELIGGFTSHSDWNKELLLALKPARKQVAVIINQALHESQL